MNLILKFSKAEIEKSFAKIYLLVMFLLVIGTNVQLFSVCKKERRDNPSV